MASPLGRGDLIVGYALAFTVVAILQATITWTIGLAARSPERRRAGARLAAGDRAGAVRHRARLFLSAFACNEFQAVQFLPAVVLPQILLGGLFVPVDRLPQGLEGVARALPLTYAFEALERHAPRPRARRRAWRSTSPSSSPRPSSSSSPAQSPCVAARRGGGRPTSRRQAHPRRMAWGRAPTGVAEKTLGAGRTRAGRAQPDQRTATSAPWQWPSW